jgi:hypothetical protein
VKKVLVSVIVAAGMVLGGTAVASAATKAPSITKPTTAAEGTATHEMSETATKQVSEAKAKTTHKKTTKKVSKKKNALATTKKK